DRDNWVGKWIFWATRIIQKSAVLKKGILDLVGKEQAQKDSAQRMSAALWDTFTGSAGYRNIFRRFLHPALLFGFLRSTLASNLPIINRHSHEKQKARQTL
ncbi:MAG: hypothetical protein KJO20_03430, partial [Eudoraea sp.]|nr:hypothetical protein [Eudoraea sp.]